MMNGQDLHERLMLSSDESEARPVDPGADLVRGRRRLRRRRIAVAVAGTAGVAALTVGIVGAAQLVSTDTGSRAASGWANPGDSRHVKDPIGPGWAPIKTFPTPATSTHGPGSSAQGLPDGSGYGPTDLAVKALWAAARDHLDPTLQHLNHDSLLGWQPNGEASGEHGFELDVKLGWTDQGGGGEGVVQISIADSAAAGDELIESLDCVTGEPPCHPIRLDDGSTAVLQRFGRSDYNLFYVQDDGDFVAVTVDPQFGNNSLTPDTRMRVPLKSAIALVQDPSINYPEPAAHSLGGSAPARRH